MSILNALIECSIDCHSLRNWPVNVQCPQCLPQCMLYEIGFDLMKWNIEGLLSRSMYFLCQIKCFVFFQKWMQQTSLPSMDSVSSLSPQPGFCHVYMLYLTLILNTHYFCNMVVRFIGMNMHAPWHPVAHFTKGFETHKKCMHLPKCYLIDKWNIYHLATKIQHTLISKITIMGNTYECEYIQS